MKILFAIPYSPVPANFGGALRVYNVIRLAAQHHDVSIITIGWPKNESEMRTAFGPQVKSIHIASRHWVRKMRRLGQAYSLFTNHSFFYLLSQNEEMQKLINRVVSENEFDIVQAEFAHMATYDYPTSALKILDAHNVEYDNFRRMWLRARSPLRKIHYKAEYEKFYHEEITACKRCDAMFVTSSRDKTIFDADVPHIPKYVVPNGVDAQYFAPSAQTPEPYSLVFTGAMSYVPNYDGMLYFLEDIFPLIVKEIPEAKVYIVGSNPPSELRNHASNNIIITDYVNDVRPYVYQSSAYIVPLRMGSGTRLKILEAMAMKKSIITTSIGCEGIDVRHGESAMIADEPKAFAENVIRVLHDAALRQKLITNGYELMKTQYEWSVIGEHIEVLYKTLVQRNQQQHPHSPTSLSL